MLWILRPRSNAHQIQHALVHAHTLDTGPLTLFCTACSSPAVHKCASCLVCVQVFMAPLSELYVPKCYWAGGGRDAVCGVLACVWTRGWSGAIFASYACAIRNILSTTRRDGLAVFIRIPRTTNYYKLTLLPHTAHTHYRDSNTLFAVRRVDPTASNPQRTNSNSSLNRAHSIHAI